MTNITLRNRDIDYEIIVCGGTQRLAAFGRLRAGISDILFALVMWRLWTLLGWNDIRQRYRRSLIGPFWITLSMAIFTVLLGVIYSYLFKMDVKVYLPYVAMGLVAWGFISSTISESCGVFTSGVGIIEQLRLPLAIHLLRSLWGNFIILLHTIILIVPIMLLTPVRPHWVNLLVLPGLFLVFANQLWVAAVVGILSTRYRDVAQLVTTAIQISMFATPIMYPVSALGEARVVADLNPFYHLVSIIRDPLLGQQPAMLSYEVVLALCFVGYILAAGLIYWANRRLVYWL